MNGNAALSDGVIEALAAQRGEYESDFETTNEPLTRLIDQFEPSDKLEAGQGLLESTDAHRRVLGARILRETWDLRAEALGLVVQAILKETDEEVLGWLLSAVSFLGDSSALDVVEGFVRHPEPRIRYHAAGAISRCGVERPSSSALDALIELSDDPHEDVRFSALFELGEWWQEGGADSRIEHRLRRALDEGDGRSRGVAVEAFSTAPPSG